MRLPVGLQEGTLFDGLRASMTQLSSILQQRRQHVGNQTLLAEEAKERAQPTGQLTLVQMWWAWLDTFSSMDCLADELRTAGQHSEAAKLRPDMLRLQQCMRGPVSPTTSGGTSISRLLSMHRSTTFADFQQQSQQQLLVLEHPDTLSSLRDMAQSMEQLLLQQNVGELV